MSFVYVQRMESFYSASADEMLMIANRAFVVTDVFLGLFTTLAAFTAVNYWDYDIYNLTQGVSVAQLPGQSATWLGNNTGTLWYRNTFTVLNPNVAIGDSLVHRLTKTGAPANLNFGGCAILMRGDYA